MMIGEIVAMSDNPLLLIVDDDPGGRKTLESLLLGQGYTLAFASDGVEALSMAAELNPDLILLDVMMPNLNGFEVCTLLRANPLLNEVPVVMITALDDRASRLHGIEAGADDFVPKPFDRTELRLRVRTITRLNRYRKLREEHAKLIAAHQELEQTYDRTIEGWVNALDLRDKETEGHTQRVTALTLQLARAYGIGEEDLVHMKRGALLHDIGKLGIPDQILLKPGPLNAQEWMVMRRHPVYAYEWLQPIPYLRPALPIPYCHHECWDGNGYPRGLVGETIPIAARIFAIVDVWDALRSERSYRKSWSSEQTAQHIKSLSGTHFDPQVVACFFSAVVPQLNASGLA
jgi:putative two-component system response regulator